MLREEVERLVAAGEFTEAELIWDGTTWRPVTDVMGGGVRIEERPKLQLKRRGDEPEAEADEEDLSDDIVPIQKVQLDAAELAQIPQRKSEKKNKRKKAKAEGKPKKERKPRAAANGSGSSGWQLYKRRIFGNDPSLGPKINIPIKIFWLLVVVFYGFRLGLGPLLAKMREKPTYVVVYNTSPMEASATLGWRRLSRDIYPRSSVCFELYVGMRERQKLTLRTKATGDTLASLRVPMWPGALVVANPDRKGEFAQIRTSLVKDDSLPSVDVNQLAEQVGNHLEPSAFLRLVPEGWRIARKALVSTRNDPIFTSSQFRFEESIVQGELEVRARFLEELRKKREQSKRQFDLIVWPPRYSVSFNGGRAMIDLNDEERIQMEIRLPRTSFKVGRSMTVKVKEQPRLEATDADGTLRLKLEFQNHTSRLGTADYEGTWRYAAAHTDGRWDWSWSFEGQNPRAPKGRQRVTYRYDRSGREHGPTFR